MKTGNFYLLLFTILLQCLCNRAVAQQHPLSPADGDIPTVDTLYKCTGRQVTLEGTAATGTGSKIRWSTGDTTATITVTDEGLYIFRIYLGNSQDVLMAKGFYVIDTSYPGISLGNDTTICSGATLTLHSPYSNTTWLGDTISSAKMVAVAGMYTAAAKDGCGAVHTDTIIVKVKDCSPPPCIFVLPDAFTPNRDGKNDVYKPVHNNMISSYLMIIYNRWGQAIFRSADINKGWDGLVTGHFADIGTYHYVCYYTCHTGGRYTMKGNIILLR